MHRDKRTLRREVLAVRDTLAGEIRAEKSASIRSRLQAHPAYLQADCVFCYASYGSEVETLPFLAQCRKDKKTVCCPRVRGKEMEFYRIDSLSDLQAGFHGIPEPPARAGYLHRPCKGTLMVMPGVVFDRDRHRIGYGGGYYDRYLQEGQGIATIALAFSCQIRETIPADPHDIRPQSILTEDETII